MAFIPSSKLPNTGTTIFSIMAKLCAEYNAINLAQGFPDIPVSNKLIELVTEYMRKGYNQYAPMHGVPALLEKLSDKYKKMYGYAPDPEKEITITCGATEACFTAITSVVHRGDEVIIFEPAFDCYANAVLLCGGVPVYIPMQYSAYSINWIEVREKITPRTKLIVINSPHNPTGTTLSVHDMHELETIVKGKEIFILSDEVYEHIVFDGQPHESVLKYPNLRQCSFFISSFGKTYHITGWRMGYCIAPPSLTYEFRKIHQFNTFSAHTPSQYALADVLDDSEMYLSLSTLLEEKRNFFTAALKKSRFVLYPSRGTYFQLASYEKISDEPDMQFAKRLVREYGVACIPVSPFYHNHLDQKIIRFCFAKHRDTLAQAAEVLCKI
ncbi:MAG: methionine aminotransferase [Cytophagaceae bacterium]|nr:methionine aminotransferase [Cytophagaceae bacterium]MDW8457131.1 methionine aminotransferase [Cytophagaceae bacterium]